MRILLFFFFPLLFTACIGDDIIDDTVAATIRIKNPIDSLTIGQSHQFDAVYLNTIGQEEPATILWNSTDPAILSITPDGLAEGIVEGAANLEATVEDNPAISKSFPVIVTEEIVNNTGNNIRNGTLRTTSSYTLEGDFSLQSSEDKLILSFGADYRASSNLPGLYVYLTNNPNSVNNAFEIGKVSVFNGTHSYTIEGVGLNEYSHLFYYCKPFSVKVGDGEFEN